MLVCWAGILTVSALPLLLLHFAANAPFPETKGFFDGLPWALVGGFLGFGSVLVATQTSCCYKGDMMFLGCFGPLMGLIGFAIGGRLQHHILFLALFFAAPFIGSALYPWLGYRAAAFVTVVIQLITIGISLFLRIKQDKVHPVNDSETIIWHKARCPQCNNLWTLGSRDTRDMKRCPTCGWSWAQAGVDPFDVPSFVQPGARKSSRKTKRS